jgi:hypothetical protein
MAALYAWAALWLAALESASSAAEVELDFAAAVRTLPALSDRV